MRKIILLLSIVFANILSSQNKGMFSHELDSIVSLDVPKNFSAVDTLINGVEIHQIEYKMPTYTLTAQRVLFEQANQKAPLSKLPYDYSSLMSEYNGVIEGMLQRIPYKLKSKTLVEKQGFKGYNLKFVDVNDKPTYETEFYLLNKNLYTFFYASETEFNELEKDGIFNSVKVNPKQDISQFLGKPPKYRIGYVVATYFFLSLIVIGIIIYTIKIYRKKMGIVSPPED